SAQLGALDSGLLRRVRHDRYNSLIYWRPRRDSNPCYRRERAMSWASRRRGRNPEREEAEQPPYPEPDRARKITRAAPGGQIYPGGPPRLSLRISRRAPSRRRSLRRG